MCVCVCVSVGVCCMCVFCDLYKTDRQTDTHTHTHRVHIHTQTHTLRMYMILYSHKQILFTYLAWLQFYLSELNNKFSPSVLIMTPMSSQVDVFTNTNELCRARVQPDRVSPPCIRSDTVSSVSGRVCLLI